MTGDYPLGADNAIREALLRADSILSLLHYRGLRDSKWNREDVAETLTLVRAAREKLPRYPSGDRGGQ